MEYTLASGSTKEGPALPETITLLGVNAEGYWLISGYGITQALTSCCWASLKGLDGYIGCRSCYQEHVEPSTLLADALVG